MAKKSALIIIAEGSEETEVVATVDILRRAGIVVTIASLGDDPCVTCSRNVKVCADVKLVDIIDKQKFDALILPGGLGGSNAFASSPEVKTFLQKQEKEDRVIAAICAAPTVLKAHDIAKGKQLTSYPAMKSLLSEEYIYLEQEVVVDGNLITSRGPATVFAFGLAIVEKLLDKNIASEVAKGMLYMHYN